MQVSIAAAAAAASRLPPDSQGRAQPVTKATMTPGAQVTLPSLPLLSPSPTQPLLNSFSSPLPPPSLLGATDDAVAFTAWVPPILYLYPSMTPPLPPPSTHITPHPKATLPEAKAGGRATQSLLFAHRKFFICIIICEQLRADRWMTWAARWAAQLDSV